MVALSLATSRWQAITLAFATAVGVGVGAVDELVGRGVGLPPGMIDSRADAPVAASSPATDAIAATTAGTLFQRRRRIRPPDSSFRERGFMVRSP